MRGKSVVEATHMLAFLPKKATGPLGALLASAIANAKNNFNISADGLFIKEIRVDGGVTLKRSMPRARGSASRINKRSSNVLITLAPIAEKPAKLRRWEKKGSVTTVATVAPTASAAVEAAPAKEVKAKKTSKK
jgi:large subunit ribosomal protein L22